MHVVQKSIHVHWYFFFATTENFNNFIEYVNNDNILSHMLQTWSAFECQTHDLFVINNAKEVL